MHPARRYGESLIARFLVSISVIGIATAAVTAGCQTPRTPTQPVATTTITVTAPPSTVTVEVAPEPHETRPNRTTSAIRPGPRSALADIDLPEGTANIETSGDSEEWIFNIPLESLVAFLQNQFANGPRYDARGATSWKGLPPCYDKGSSPPQGGKGIIGDWEWRWEDHTGQLLVYIYEDKKKLVIQSNRYPINDVRCPRS